MASNIHKLNNRKCRRFIAACLRLGKTRILNDGGGLYLRATGTGTASWIFRYEIAGQRHEQGLGSYGTYTLEEARERARRCRQQLDAGRDPIAERQAERNAVQATRAVSKSFKFCAEQYVAGREKGWRSDKHRQDWINSLARYSYHVIGGKLVSQLTVTDILEVLRPYWETRTETMRRVQNRMELVLAWSGAHGFRPPEAPNPARWRGNLDAFLDAKARPATKHFAALHYSKLPELVAALQSTPDTSSDGLLFCLLTAARSKEIRFAQWTEINFAAATWTIPAAKMKTEREHRVPLTGLALAILRRQPSYPGEDTRNCTGPIFCFQPGKPMGERPMRRRLCTVFPGITVHGTVRAGFATWASDLANCPVPVREAALAHAEHNKTVTAYNRTDYLAQRVELMQKWETFLTTPFGSNVTSLAQAA